MDEWFVKHMEDFFTERINSHRQQEPASVNEAYNELRTCTEQLSETLTEEQRRLLRDCENAYHLTDGETGRFYYKAGFRDALDFLMNAGKET